MWGGANSWCVSEDLWQRSFHSLPQLLGIAHDAGVGLGEQLVCTVGALAVWPGASNVIAGGANFTVDIRCRADALRDAVVADATASVAAICARCRVLSACHAKPLVSTAGTCVCWVNLIRESYAKPAHAMMHAQLKLRDNRGALAIMAATAVIG